MSNPRTILAEGLRDGFVEFLEGDEDVMNLLMDKLAPYLDDKIPFVDEDVRFDIGLQILSTLSIR